MQTVGLEPELEGDSPPTRELAGSGKFPRAGLHALQSLAQVSPLSCHKGKFSAGPGLTAGTLRVTPNDLGIVHEDTGYASLRQRPREFVGASAKGIALSSRAPLQLARAWNFYFSFQSLPSQPSMPPTGNGSTPPTGAGLASSISTREQLLIDAETKGVAFHLAIGYGPRGNLILVVRAPLGITLVRGLEVTFGAQPVQRAPFNICLSDGCQAVLILSKPLQEEILKAERTLITAYAPNGTPYQAVASLKGPGTAIDTLNKRRGPS